MGEVIGGASRDPREPVVIDDVALIGVRIDEYGMEHVVLGIMSRSSNVPIALWTDLTVEQVHRIQVALGQKLRALNS